jgi:hypothetical protein
MNNIDRISWHILNAMADDWESLEQIHPSVNRDTGPVSREVIIEHLEDLKKERLVQIMDDKDFNGIEILKDPIEYWFGMTESGRSLWNSESNKYEKE